MALNKLYKEEPALYQRSFDANGFEWIVNDDAENSVLVYLRRGLDTKDDIIVVVNLTPIPRHNYRFGVNGKGTWKEIFNSDAVEYWGSGITNTDKLAEPRGSHWKANSIEITIPPLAIVMFKAI